MKPKVAEDSSALHFAYKGRKNKFFNLTEHFN